jgi:hypothetical protein
MSSQVAKLLADQLATEPCTKCRATGIDPMEGGTCPKCDGKRVTPLDDIARVRWMDIAQGILDATCDACPGRQTSGAKGGHVMEGGEVVPTHTCESCGAVVHVFDAAGESMSLDGWVIDSLGCVCPKCAANHGLRLPGSCATCGADIFAAHREAICTNGHRQPS